LIDPAGEVVSGQLGRVDLDLASNEVHRRRRDLTYMAREADLASKNFSNNANPNRVGPNLLAVSSQSASTNVRESMRSSRIPLMAHHNTLPNTARCDTDRRRHVAAGRLIQAF
jgi:hypothetical protein